MKQVSGIYLITINTKGYIGSSVNIKRRLIQHQSDLKNNRHCNKYLQNAYNKYQDFSTTILEEIVDASADELKNRETYYIKLLKPVCNIQDPETNFHVKPVYQFDLQGNLINCYSSVTLASNVLGFSESHIQHAAQPDNVETKSAAGYYWSYKKEIQLPKDHRHTQIHVYDLSGKYTETYNTLKECIESLYPHRVYSSVASVINRITKCKTAQLEGYRFSYNKVEQLDNKKLLNIKHNYPIVQISYNNCDEIKIWANVKSAAEHFNCTANLFINAIHKHHRCQGFYWKRLGN
jgi:hypothetical protein